MNTQIYIGKVVKLTRYEPQYLENFNTSPHLYHVKNVRYWKDGPQGAPPNPRRIL